MSEGKLQNCHAINFNHNVIITVNQKSHHMESETKIQAKNRPTKQLFKLQIIKPFWAAIK
jgi:hypothetical protein